MPAHRAVLESENSSKADNARKNTAFPPVCKKCAKVCRAKTSPAKQAVSHSPKSWNSTVFIVQNLPVLSKQQSYMTHRFYGRV